MILYTCYTLEVNYAEWVVSMFKFVKKDGAHFFLKVIKTLEVTNV